MMHLQCMISVDDYCVSLVWMISVGDLVTYRL